jgi:hypothetical protein
MQVGVPSGWQVESTERSQGLDQFVVNVHHSTVMNFAGAWGRGALAVRYAVVNVPVRVMPVRASVVALPRTHHQ